MVIEIILSYKKYYKHKYYIDRIAWNYFITKQFSSKFFKYWILNFKHVYLKITYLQVSKFSLAVFSLSFKDMKVRSSIFILAPFFWHFFLGNRRESFCVMVKEREHAGK